MRRQAPLRFLGFLVLLGLFLYISATTDDVRDGSTRPRVDLPDRSAATGVVHGRVAYVFDGDTLSLQLPDRTERVRLVGIDAPEKGQPAADQSRDYLRQLCGRRNVKVVIAGKDQYDRILGDVYLGDRWLNGALVEAGYAWSWSDGDRADELASLQDQARQRQLGLWAHDQVEPPWEFRRDHPDSRRTTR